MICVDRRPAELRRSGFTLVELLVVLLIVGILAGMSYAVLGRTGTTARIAATRSTIEQVDSLLAERMEAFRRADFRNQANLLMAQYNSPSASNPLTLTRQAAERMVRKDRFRSAFPQRFEDLLGLDGERGDGAGLFNRNPDGTVPPASFANFGEWDDAPLALVIRELIATGQFDPTAHDPATESSELLYLALTRGTGYGIPLESLDGIPSRHIGDTDGDGLLEILDDWGNPIRFYNWPTRLMRAGPAGDVFDPTVATILVADRPPGFVDWTDADFTHPLKQDPDDPFGELLVYFGAPYELDRGGPVTMDPFGEDLFHSPNTWHRPLLVSAGPDGDLGLEEPVVSGAARLGYADLSSDEVVHRITDNITNRQRAGGGN